MERSLSRRLRIVGWAIAALTALAVATAGWIIAPYHGPDLLYHRTTGFVLRAPFADRIVVGDSRVELARHDDAALYVGYSGATTRSLARLVGVLCHVSDAPIVVALGINDTKPHETDLAASAEALGRMADSCGAGRLHLAGIWPAEDDVGVGGTDFSNRVAQQVDAVMLAMARRGEVRFTSAPAITGHTWDGVHFTPDTSRRYLRFLAGLEGA